MPETAEGSRKSLAGLDCTWAAAVAVALLSCCVVVLSVFFPVVRDVVVLGVVGAVVKMTSCCYSYGCSY